MLEDECMHIIIRFHLTQVKKLQDRVTKAKEEVSRSREKYEQSLREISDYNPKYIEVGPQQYCLLYLISQQVRNIIYLLCFCDHPFCVYCLENHLKGVKDPTLIVLTGHDPCVWQSARVRVQTPAVLQGDALCHTQMPKYFQWSQVSCRHNLHPWYYKTSNDI